MDIAVTNDRLFVATYGDGLFEYVHNTWQSIASPLFINELVPTPSGLLIGADNGLHRLTSAGYTTIIAGTAGHYFINGSILQSADKILASSHAGLLIVQQTTPIPQPDVISYVKTANGLLLHPAKVEIKTAWLDIALANYDYANHTNNNNQHYQYRVNSNEWHTLSVPLIQLNNLAQGLYSVEYRKSVGESGWSIPQTYSFRVGGPWYATQAAYIVYVAAIVLLLLYLSYLVIRWVRSFHTAFKTNKALLQQSGINEALRKLTQGVAAFDVNNQSGGLSNINRAIELIAPLVHRQAFLGAKSLTDGLTYLQMMSVTSYVNKEVRFNVTLDPEPVAHELACDIYAVIYHSLLNALQQTHCTAITVGIIQIDQLVVVTCTDNGDSKSRITRLVDFTLGEYIIKRIAKDNNTKVVWRSAKGQNTMTVGLPLRLAQPQRQPLAAVK
jgi:hypothetical protein